MSRPRPIVRTDKLELEKIEPDSRLEAIIEMNLAIVQMNAEIVRILANPLVVARQPEEHSAASANNPDRV